ncbi:hypothetical protein [Caldibacillus debilis]|uniref:hypothetical protein n=1 Tax=Caldibacillus debilis TaxID=301148 RepID=UPI0023EFA3E4|nr:hypothetical protein [Caldibacillus debilis]
MIIQIKEANELPATGHSSQPKKKMGRPFSVYDRKKAALSKNGNNGTCRIKSSHLCKILLPVKGTSPSGNGTALRPLLFTQNPGLHPRAV